jgi:signal transduction histidine kinase
MARFTPAARTTLQQAGIRLILPLRLHDRVIGALLLGEKQSGQDYLPEDMEMLLALGAQITLALQNAALTRAFLHRRTHEITAGSRRFVQMMEQERHLLAADLHDQTLPELRCLLTDLEELAAREDEGKLADTATEVHHTARDMAEHLRCTIQDIRDIMESLSPSALEMLGLMPALENELRKSAARARPPLRPQFQAHHPIPPRALTPFVELSLFRILQEGITNACRHAQAATVRLQVSLEENEYVLRLEDDGTGMPAEEARPHGRGLDNMRFRAGLIGAQISWSVPEGGAGTRVEVRLPQEPPAAIERLSGGHREQN